MNIFQWLILSKDVCLDWTNIPILMQLFTYFVNFGRVSLLPYLPWGAMAKPIMATEDDERVKIVQSPSHCRWSGINTLIHYKLYILKCKKFMQELKDRLYIKNFQLSFGSWWLGSLFNNSSGDSFTLHSRNLEILPFFHLLSLILPIILKQAKQDGNVRNGLAAATTMHVNWCKNLQSICNRLSRDGLSQQLPLKGQYIVSYFIQFKNCWNLRNLKPRFYWWWHICAS